MQTGKLMFAEKEKSFGASQMGWEKKQAIF